MSNSFYHNDLTDGQWDMIKNLFPAEKKVGRPSLNTRTVFNGILWILKNRARWRDLPARYGNWNSVYHKFWLWCESGFFRRLLKLVNQNAQHSSLFELDSTFCKVHQSACSGLRNQAIGASRGGKTTKIHVLLNERMQLMNVVLTGGQILDSEPALDLLAGVELTNKKVRADRADSCQSIRHHLEERGVTVCISDKANFRIKHDFDTELYKRRHIVERFFQRIKNYRHIATRYDKLAICFENFVLLATFAIHF